MTIADFQRNLKALDLMTVLDEVLKRFTPELLDLNTSQLEEGKASDNTNVGTYVDSEYAKFKKLIGSKSSPIVDLKVTGDFYSDFERMG